MLLQRIQLELHEWPSGRRLSSLGENSDDDAAVDAKLGGDGADQPLLNMIVTEYLSLELTGGDRRPAFCPSYGGRPQPIAHTGLDGHPELWAAA